MMDRMADELRRGAHAEHAGTSLLVCRSAMNCTTVRSRRGGGPGAMPGTAAQQRVDDHGYVVSQIDAALTAAGAA